MPAPVATGREIVVGSMLIRVRASLIAFAGGLVVIGPGLILIAPRLVAVRPGLVVVSTHLELRAARRAGRNRTHVAAGWTSHERRH